MTSLIISRKLNETTIKSWKNQHFKEIKENCPDGTLPIFRSRDDNMLKEEKNDDADNEDMIELIARSGYVLAHSGKHKVPLWVSERIDRTRLDGSAIISFMGRLFEKDFCADPLIVGPKAALEDYYNTNHNSDNINDDDQRLYDPGHLAAAGNIVNKNKKYKEMRKETYFLSNNAPMYKSFNRGIWLQLEKYIRRIVKEHYGMMWVISGTAFIYNATDGNNDINVTKTSNNSAGLTIGAGKVSVPTHFWKIVAVPRTNKENCTNNVATTTTASCPTLAVTAFLLGHAQNQGGDIHSFQSSLSYIEKVTGWSFFPGFTIEEKKMS